MSTLLALLLAGPAPASSPVSAPVSAPVSTAASSARRPEAGALTARLQRAAPGLAPEVLADALDAVHCARTRGDLPGDGPAVLALIDFSLPSTEERLWVLDLDTGELLFRELVSHGQGTGDDRAVAFSNTPESHQSSLGLFRTAETYHGKHGYSLRLDGLEPGVNDRARQRAIVVHGADYATESFIDRNGRLGRSWGCPAVDKAVSAEVIDAIKGGGALFAWYPDESWRSGSRYLGCSAG